jgi:hypothetical protein
VTTSRLERVGLLVSFAALGVWAFAAITFAGFLSLVWFGHAGWYTWLLFPIPFAIYVLVYAFRRWREPLVPE